MFESYLLCTVHMDALQVMENRKLIGKGFSFALFAFIREIIYLCKTNLIQMK